MMVVQNKSGRDDDAEDETAVAVEYEEPNVVRLGIVSSIRAVRKTNRE